MQRKAPEVWTNVPQIQNTGTHHAALNTNHSALVHMTTASSGLTSEMSRSQTPSFNSTNNTTSLIASKQTNSVPPVLDSQTGHRNVMVGTPFNIPHEAQSYFYNQNMSDVVHQSGGQVSGYQSRVRTTNWNPSQSLNNSGTLQAQVPSSSVVGSHQVYNQVLPTNQNLVNTSMIGRSNPSDNRQRRRNKLATRRTNPVALNQTEQIMDSINVEKQFHHLQSTIQTNPSENLVNIQSGIPNKENFRACLRTNEQEHLTVRNPVLGAAMNEASTDLRKDFEEASYDVPKLSSSGFLNALPSSRVLNAVTKRRMSHSRYNELRKSIIHIHNNRLFLCRFCDKYVCSYSGCLSRIRIHYNSCTKITPNRRKALTKARRHIRRHLPTSTNSHEDTQPPTSNFIEEQSANSEELSADSDAVRRCTDKRVMLQDVDNIYERSVTNNRHGFAKSNKTNSFITSENHSTTKAGSKLVCTPELAEEISEGIVKAIVLDCLSFSIYDEKNGIISPQVQLIDRLVPGFSEYCPTSSTLSTTYLGKLYCKTLATVKNEIQKCLSHSMGTIIFDGWDDVNSAPVINVLLRTEPNGSMRSRVFFLRTIYPGHKSMTASQYYREIETVLTDFCSFSNICAITSDNTSACRNARALCEANNDGVVSVNDQAHIADLLMEDIGKIPWIKAVIDKVAAVNADLHRHRKMKVLFTEEQVKWNSLYEKRMLTVKKKYGIPNIATYISENARHSSNVLKDLEVEGLAVKGYFFDRSIMLRKQSNTRFAYAEDCLDSFVRGISILRKIVNDEAFDSFYAARNDGDRIRRYNKFVEPIQNDEFFETVLTILHILRPLRRYLRIFDSSSARISHVWVETEKLQNCLENLQTDDKFLDEARKKQLLDVFLRRRNGTGSVQARLIEDVHCVAVLLDPTRCPSNFKDYVPILRAHALKYGRKNRSSEETKLAEDICDSFVVQASKWLCDPEELRNDRRHRYGDDPLHWWNTSHCDDPILTRFAINTLSCSPTAMAVDRSFSIEKNIHTSKLNRLSSSKVAQIMFVKWNDDLLSGRSSFDKDEFMNSLCKYAVDMQKIENSTEPTMPLQIHEEEPPSVFPEPPPEWKPTPI